MNAVPLVTIFSLRSWTWCLPPPRPAPASIAAKGLGDRGVSQVVPMVVPQEDASPPRRISTTEITQCHIPRPPTCNESQIHANGKRETAKSRESFPSANAVSRSRDRLVRFAFVTDYHRFAQTLDPPHTSFYRTSVVINTVSNTHISPLRWCGAPSFDESLGSRRQSLSDTPARAARSRPASLPPSCRGRRPRRCTSRGRPPQSRAGCRSGFGGSRSPRGSPQ